MKTLNLLFISFIITFAVLVSISPAIAKPSFAVQHLNVASKLNTTHTSYHITLISGAGQTNLVSNYRNTLSNNLIFASPNSSNEQRLTNTMKVFSKSKNFFTSFMLLNDKLHQFISYFSTLNNTSPIRSEASGQESKSIKKKCKNDLDFS